ncbi:SusC/RagA family TonB-linked outer membrane protein [Arachidicoccus terrestris]|uniref:SusC/RagA family TonB-linked outer membrane protein n=1 Tax=Arachidicoccus terrestris TaxID=2875539 RepID=UPI001CC61B89|nr:TonB-dependent receptor [Arachidicoccus terrestris]UAY57015.1 TonB-dependent receptor [Arachidicoccus terrestris]
MQNFVKRNIFVSLLLMVGLGLFAGTDLYAQAGNSVPGQVTDATGKPIAGASILNLNSNKGVTSGQDGGFSINVSPNDSLQVTFIGYLKKVIVYSGQKNISVTLVASDANLGDVVVIGYGTQMKEAVTGSVASISGESLKEVPAANISDAMQGRLPGVAISQTSSKPGATMQIRIRGTRSLTANNDPLIVLDGIPFPGSIGDIDMNSVKSVDILKDASATAIYGSRGANGVILITTFKGKKGQDARVTASSYYGLSKVFAQFPMMDGPKLLALRKAAGQFVNQDGSVQLGAGESDSVNTNWQDLLYQTGNVTNENVNVSAGTKNGSYNFGASYYRNQAVIPTQNYQRYAIHGSIDQNIGKYVRIGFTTNNNYNITHGSQVGIYGALSNSPLADPYNPDGSIKYSFQMPLSASWVYTKEVIDSLKDKWASNNNNFASYNSLYAEVKIPWIQGLAYRVNVGLNINYGNSGSYKGEGINSTNPLDPSTASIGNSVGTDWTLENLLTYDRTFNKHRINAVGLFSSEQNRYHSTYISGIGIPEDQLQYFNIGTASDEIDVLPENQNYWERGLVSWMGRVMYAYDNKYMISATLRSDGASVLAPGHQWHTYPAVSVGWNISRESFMKNLSFINELKLRVGVGQTSNQAVSPYSTMGRLGTNYYNFGDTYATGYYVSTLPNPNLGWEYSKTWNYGLDFGLFNDRLSGTIEYYITKTNGLLQSVGLPATSGVGSYTANVGNTENKGLELSLNGTILQDNNGWTWNAGVNLSFNRNKITHLASGVMADVGNSWFVGHPINVIYDYERIGLWTAADSASGLLKQLQPGGNVGGIRVKYTGGFNEDGTAKRPIGDDDRQIINTDPSFTGGFNTSVAYKGFDLGVVGVFQHGGVLISTLYGSSGYLNLMTGRSNNVDIDYWTPTNTQARYPKPGGQMSGDNPIYGSTLGYFDASYLKIRTITLGYNFAKSRWLKSSSISQMRVYFSVQNPFVMFSPYHSDTGLDPETNSYGDQNAAVSSFAHRLLTQGTNTPSTRNFLLGLNLTF